MERSGLRFSLLRQPYAESRDVQGGLDQNTPCRRKFWNPLPQSGKAGSPIAEARGKFLGFLANFLENFVFLGKFRLI